MPRVPRLTGPSVTPRGLPAPQVSPEATGAPLARAAGALGQQLAAVVEEERARAVQVQTDDALLQLRSARDRTLYDPDKGVLNARRANAREAPRMLDEAWQREVSRIAAGLTDPDAREAFMRAADRERVETESIVMRHVDDEINAFTAETATRKAGVLANDALVFAGDAVGEAKLAEREAVVRQELMRQGLRDESLEAAIAEDRSKIRAAQIESLALRNPQAAQALLDRVGAELREVDRPKVSQFVQAADLEVGSQTARDELFAEFGLDGEQAALDAARSRYSGKMEDEVVRRVRDLYNERKQGVTQRGNDLLEQAIQAAGVNGNLDAVPRDVMVALRTQYPTKFRALRDYAQVAQTGTAIISDVDALQELHDKTVDQWLTLDLNEYRARLSYDDFRQMQTYQRNIKNPASGQARGGMQPREIDTAILSAAVDAELIPNVGTMTGLNQYPRDKEAFGRLRAAIYQSIEAERTKLGRGLTEPEQRAIIQRVLDDRVLRTAGRNREMPRAMVGNAPYEELEGRDFYTRYPTAPRPRANLQATDRDARWRELTAAGVPADVATQQVLREIP